MSDVNPERNTGENGGQTERSPAGINPRFLLTKFYFNSSIRLARKRRSGSCRSLPGSSRASAF